MKTVKTTKSKGQVEVALKNNWLEVTPYSVVGGMIPDFCLMVFKEKQGSKSFAIPLSHLQGDILAHHEEEPFRFTKELLSALNIYVGKCFFFNGKKGEVKAQLMLSGESTSLSSIILNASDIIPFAIRMGCRFFLQRRMYN